MNQRSGSAYFLLDILIDIGGVEKRRLTYSNSSVQLKTLCQMRFSVYMYSQLVVAAIVSESVAALALTRRQTLGWLTGTAVATVTSTANAVADLPDSFDVDNFLKTGMVQTPMGVSGQAGKSRPETGVVLRDGSEVMRDSRTGDVLAEIILKNGSDKVPVLASYSSPWPLATGTVFDVECRDSSGDAAFLSVTSDTGGKDLSELKDSFFVDQLFAPTGRFSFYGQPTDVKVKKSSVGNLGDDYRVLDLSFSFPNSWWPRSLTSMRPMCLPRNLAQCSADWRVQVMVLPVS